MQILIEYTSIELSIELWGRRWASSYLLTYKWKQFAGDYLKTGIGEIYENASQKENI